MPTARLTTFEYALLGLLDATPRSGYDVHRLFATTPLAHYSSSPGAIYPALKRLAQRGLLRATLDRTTEARPRRVFSVTGRGRSALEAWLRQPVTREELVRDEGAPLLRFAFAEGRLSPAEVMTFLKGFRREVSAYLEELAPHLEAVAAQGTLHGRLALEYGIRGYESAVAWIDGAISEIRRSGRRRPASRRKT